MKTAQILTDEQIHEMLIVLQGVFRQVGPRIVEQAGKVAHADKQDGFPVADIDIEVREHTQTNA